MLLKLTLNLWHFAVTCQKRASTVETYYDADKRDDWVKPDDGSEEEEEYENLPEASGTGNKIINIDTSENEEDVHEEKDILDISNLDLDEEDDAAAPVESHAMVGVLTNVLVLFRPLTDPS